MKRIILFLCLFISIKIQAQNEVIDLTNDKASTDRFKIINSIKFKYGNFYKREVGVVVQHLKMENNFAFFYGNIREKSGKSFIKGEDEMGFGGEADGCYVILMKKNNVWKIVEDIIGFVEFDCYYWVEKYSVSPKLFNCEDEQVQEPKIDVIKEEKIDNKPQNEILLSFAETEDKKYCDENKIVPSDCSGGYIYFKGDIVFYEFYCTGSKTDFIHYGTYIDNGNSIVCNFKSSYFFNNGFNDETQEYTEFDPNKGKINPNDTFSIVLEKLNCNNFIYGYKITNEKDKSSFYYTCNNGDSDKSAEYIQSFNKINYFKDLTAETIADTKNVEVLKLPFVGERMYNLMGGRGGDRIIRIDANGWMEIGTLVPNWDDIPSDEHEGTYNAKYEFEADIYQGMYSDIITTGADDIEGDKYKIYSNKICMLKGEQLKWAIEWENRIEPKNIDYACSEFYNTE